MSNTQEMIAQVCDEIKELLITKNKAYGDSALDPVRIFSSADPIEQLKVRIDDKISRISRGKEKEYVPEDTLQDLIGYLVLLDVAQRRAAEAEEDQGWDDPTTGATFRMDFTVTDVDPDIWVTLSKGEPKEGDTVTVLPMRYTCDGPKVDYEHPLHVHVPYLDN